MPAVSSTCLLTLPACLPAAYPLQVIDIITDLASALPTNRSSVALSRSTTADQNPGGVDGPIGARGKFTLGVWAVWQRTPGGAVVDGDAQHIAWVGPPAGGGTVANKSPCPTRGPLPAASCQALQQQRIFLTCLLSIMYGHASLPFCPTAQVRQARARLQPYIVQIYCNTANFDAPGDTQLCYSPATWPRVVAAKLVSRSDA